MLNEVLMCSFSGFFRMEVGNDFFCQGDFNVMRVCVICYLLFKFSNFVQWFKVQQIVIVLYQFIRNGYDFVKYVIWCIGNVNVVV